MKLKLMVQFREIKLAVRKHLFSTLQETSIVDGKQEYIISAVASDVDVHWTLLSVDIQSENQAMKLLKQFVGLWLTTGWCLDGTITAGHTN